MEKYQGSFVFEGMVSLRALIERAQNSSSARRIGQVLYSAERKEKYPKEYAFLAHRAEEGLFELCVLPRAVIDARASGKTHGGVIALCGERNYRDIDRADLPQNGFFVMMEGIEDPYNFGYALRSLYAAGVDGVILTRLPCGADGTVCRSSAGASERMEVYFSSPERAVSLFKEKGYKIICADLPHSVPVYEADLTRPLLLVIGGEKRGITRTVLDSADAVVRLIYGKDFDEALSAASAASILAFEVLRQNR